MRLDAEAQDKVFVHSLRAAASVEKSKMESE